MLILPAYHNQYCAAVPTQLPLPGQWLYNCAAMVETMANAEMQDSTPDLATPPLIPDQGHDRALSLKETCAVGDCLLVLMKGHPGTGDYHILFQIENQ